MALAHASIAPQNNRRKAVVIISSWNRRFRGMHDLDFDAPSPAVSPTLVTIGSLSDAEITDDCKLADQPNDPAQAMAKLAQRFTGGCFGQSPDPDGVWHGSAIADIAAEADPDDAGIWSLSALGVGGVIPGDFSGWNLGLSVGGWGGMMIAAVQLAVIFGPLMACVAEMAALPFTGWA